MCDLTLTHIDIQRLGGLRSSKNAWDWRLCLRTGRNTETARHRMSNVALEHSVLTRNVAGYFQINDYLMQSTQLCVLLVQHVSIF